MQWLNNIKIRDKHIFIFGVLLAVLIVFAIFAVAEIMNIGDKSNDLVNTTQTKQTLISDAINDINTIRLANMLTGYTLEEGNFMNIVSRNLKAAEQSAMSFPGRLDDFLKLVESDQSLSEREIHQHQVSVKGIHESFAKYMEATQRLKNAAAANNRDEVIKIYEEVIPMGNDLNDKLQDTRDIIFYEALKKSSDSVDNTARAINIIIIIAVVFILLSVAAAFLIVRSIVRPISKMEKAVAEIANGNLSYPVRTDRKDELGSLSVSISNMVNELSNQEAIEYRDALLDAVNKAAAVLLTASEEKFDSSLLYGMETMGNTVEATRIMIMKNEMIGGNLHFTYQYEWMNDTGIQLEPIQKGSCCPYSVFADCIDTFLQDKCVNGAIGDLTPDVRLFFSAFDVKSTLIIPIFIEEEFWGLVCFLDCKDEAAYNEDEVSILHSGALMMVSAVNRHMQAAEIREMNDRTKLLLDSMPYACHLWNRDFEMFDCNEENVRLFNLKDKQEVMEQFPRFAPEFQPNGRATSDVVGDVLSEAFDTGYCRFEFMHLTSEGKPLPVEMTLVRVPYGGVYVIAAYARDLREHNKMMDEIKEKTDQLKIAMNDARAANETKSEFLANISHEMRTPLNAVLGLTGLTLENENLDNETIIDLEKVYSAGSTLLNIVNDILDISKIEAGKLEILPSEYDIPSLVNDVITQNILRIGSKLISFDLDITPDVPAMLYGDDLRIRQILNNLLSNAFKYTNEGHIEFGIRCESAVDDDSVWLSAWVKDTGQGIRPEDIEKLFSDYSQVDTKANRKIEGTGLGLAITKKMVELMDGRISVESEYGKGSTFTMRIKQGFVSDETIGEAIVKNLKSFRYSNAKRRQSARIVRIKMPYARVLVVDDNVTNLDVAKGLMKPYGLQVDCVTSGQQAINAISEEEGRYNAVFMDHMMPGMDGIEATQRIREIGTEYAQKIPIIALTANAIAGNEEKFINKGFQAFLSKPIDLPRLDEALRHFVRDKSKETAEMKEVDSGAGKTGKTQPVSPGLSVAGLDLDKGLERFGGDEYVLFGVLRSYAVNTRPVLESLKAVTKDSLSDYAINVHGIKSSSKGIFAAEIGDLAEKLEKASKDGDLDYVEKHNHELLVKTEKLICDIEGMLDSLSSDNPKDKKSEPDRGLLEELATALENYDIDSVNAVMKELEGFEYDSGAELLDMIRDGVLEGDLDTIAEKLKDRLR